jgi:hypothetical protein
VSDPHAGRLTVAWALAVLAFAVVPTHAALSSTVGKQETLATEVGHFFEFAVLAALASWWAIQRAESRASETVEGPGQGWAGLGARLVTAACVWVAAVAYGAMLELIQMPLAYRSAQAGDLAVDAAGAFAGLLAFSCVRALRGRGLRARAR